MFRDEIVKMMTDYINNMNREGALSIGAVSEEVDKSIEQMQPELNRVNGELYDMLKENGIIP
jgi:predicted HTH domain antitoxin